ncbi:MAG: hypothetical protein GY860_25430 [Desulfobacteraceae bacterium]|nr:hypothetical protein [Desulfobacteraceae bacterium]
MVFASWIAWANNKMGWQAGGPALRLPAVKDPLGDLGAMIMGCPLSEGLRFIPTAAAESAIFRWMMDRAVGVIPGPCPGVFG